MGTIWLLKKSEWVFFAKNAVFWPKNDLKGGQKWLQCIHISKKHKKNFKLDPMGAIWLDKMLTPAMTPQNGPLCDHLVTGDKKTSDKASDGHNSVIWSVPKVDFLYFVGNNILQVVYDLNWNKRGTFWDMIIWCLAKKG